MSRTVPSPLPLCILTLLVPVELAAQGDNAAKIASAMSAAPPAIARNATIMDWPDSAGRMATLRPGTNGWTCIPSQPKSRYITSNAMCGDRHLFELLTAMFAGRTPAVTGIGYSYMLSNETWESNTDPRAMTPAPDNQWHHVGPHVMVVYPDKTALAELPVMPSSNGPYVMWAGTPYAHVMWPVK
jgi:hypothetical protein